MKGIESKEREKETGTRVWREKNVIVFTALRLEVVVEVSGSFGLGTGRVPRAIPTMAVM